MVDLIYLENFAREIIELCNNRLTEYSCLEEKNFSVEQNCLDINAILREFTELLDYWKKNQKLLLYSRKLPIGSRWTIIDSAEFDCLEDNQLFDKVRNYNKLCKSVEAKYLEFKHE